VHTFGNPYRAQPVIAMDVEKGRQLAVPAEITFLQAINQFQPTGITIIRILFGSDELEDSRQ
jgi:hypothetical protein